MVLLTLKGCMGFRFYLSLKLRFLREMFFKFTVTSRATIKPDKILPHKSQLFVLIEEQPKQPCQGINVLGERKINGNTPDKFLVKKQLQDVLCKIK